MKMLQYRFVEFIPEILEDGVLYVSMEYCTAIHKCVCGCGNKVVTPISPTGWQLEFDGKSISLSPSIGNWNFDCQSHYWIKKNEIKHAIKWNQDEIQEGRDNDLKMKDDFYFSADKRLDKTEEILDKPKSRHWNLRHFFNFFYKF
ncbi:hypothetical protein FF52_05890 [Flavobacterium sp. F52]|uniref:Uncharacterized protein n=2 Tax=Flavobacteriaceae TaxID=49546 RepID=A5FFE6_FLAJ1|nr:hypothetical protein Fjoh_3055 [Flavobacterium johnsoniae UW101]EJG02187.1 hypothetical protein FF52_05890 [Flavobacterium sp. F52]OXG00558.1 hypothetical protein B0A63_08540 [Flavobacterium johnsoniae UW101]SHK65078.1 hypothetical protein SAMN05444146_1789 [Flavobacterium johnsoniae]